MARIDEKVVYTHDKEWQTPACREADRRAIQAQVDAWLAAGNQPVEIPFGLSAHSPKAVRAKAGRG